MMTPTINATSKIISRRGSVDKASFSMSYAKDIIIALINNNKISDVATAKEQLIDVYSFIQQNY